MKTAPFLSYEIWFSFFAKSLKENTLYSWDSDGGGLSKVTTTATTTMTSAWPLLGCGLQDLLLFCVLVHTSSIRRVEMLKCWTYSNETFWEYFFHIVPWSCCAIFGIREILFAFFSALLPPPSSCYCTTPLPFCSKHFQKRAFYA